MSVRSYFDRELAELHADLLRMAQLAEDAIDKSITALQTKDQNLARAVIENDREIDAAERAIESRSLKLLLQQQPVARDLRSISTALKIITDLERIGDQAADIAEISLRFEQYGYLKEVVHIPEMARIASEMVHDSVKAFLANDADSARAIIARDDEVDDLFNVVKKEISGYILGNTSQADQAIDFLMIAKYLERIGDHATNVAEWVIFHVTGEHKDSKII